MDWTLMNNGPLTALLGLLSIRVIWREHNLLVNQLLKKGQETMPADTFLHVRIETVD